MKLSEARKNARYTQQQAADHLGISRPTYARMEAYPGSVTIDEAEALGKLYDVDPNDIFFESDYS